jgi:hypothetical protein
MQHTYVEPALERVAAFAKTRGFGFSLATDSKGALQFVEEHSVPGVADTGVVLAAGDSRLTVPQIRAQHPNLTCDLFHVDGGHYRDVPLADIRNALALMQPGGVIVMDDYVPGALEIEEAFAIAPTAAWRQIVREGYILETSMRVIPSKPARGWVMGIVQAIPTPSPVAATEPDVAAALNAVPVTPSPAVIGSRLGG